MNKQQEQYLHQLTSVAATAYNQYGQRPCFPPYMGMAAAAVAAKVLRDVKRFFDGDDIGQEGIREFAAERGIDLNAKLD